MDTLSSRLQRSHCQCLLEVGPFAVVRSISFIISLPLEWKLVRDREIVVFLSMVLQALIAMTCTRLDLKKPLAG